MLVVRIVILSAALAALLAGICVAPRTAAPQGAHGAAEYVCPMHPQVTAATAGQCPICGMALARADGVALDLRRNIGVVRSRLTSREIVAPAWHDRSPLVSALLYDDEIAMLA